MAMASSDGELVLLETKEGVARITINRAAKRNALSLAVVEQIVQCLNQAEKDPSVKVAILTGAGDRAFAAGADLDELPDAFANAASAEEYDRKVTRLYRAIETSRLPVVARMAGAAIGGGCLLALACDIRIASSTVKVGFPVAKIGLMLSAHEYRLILDQMPLSRAKMLLFSGQILSATAALSYGLIDVVVEPDQLDASVGDFVGKIAMGAPLAIAASKRISNALARHSSIEEAVSESYRSVYSSADLSEGLTAIKEKRAPRFTGE